MRIPTGVVRALLALLCLGLAACGGVFAKKRGGGGSETPSGSLAIADADQWSKDVVGGAVIPGAAAMAAGGYESCSEYEAAFMEHAKLVQAMYLRRFLAWADYNLKAGTFASIPLIPGHDLPAGSGGVGGGGGDVGATAGGAKGSAPEASAEDAVGANAGSGDRAGGDEDATGGGAAAPAEAGAKGYETNNQEVSAARVDETDYVKSDGKLVFVAHGDVLRVSDLTGKLLDTHLLIGETPRGLHLFEGRLVLITEARNVLRNSTSIGTMAVADASYWRSYYEFSRQIAWQADQYVQVREFTVGADGRLTLARQRTAAGYFREGREVAGLVHSVAQQKLPWSVLGTGLALDLHPAYAGFRTPEDIRRYAADVAADNLNFVRRMLFQDTNELMGDHVATYLAGDCSRFNRITSQMPDAINGALIKEMLDGWDAALAWTPSTVVVPTWFAQYPLLPEFNHMLQVVSVDLAAAKDDQRAFSFGPQFPQVVYASASTLVTGGAAATWDGFFERLRLLGDAETHGVVRVTPQPLKNSIAQRFDFVVFALGETGALPAGFGSVPGVPRDQYALDVVDGVLRIAVTETTGTEPNQISQILNGNQPQPTTTTETALHVLAAEGREWKGVGRVVLPAYRFLRYFDGSAVLATASEIVAVDLRAAAAPVVAGRLAMTESIQYLHPIGRDGVLMAMGGREVPIDQPETCAYRQWPTQTRDLVLVRIDASNPAALVRGVEATVNATPALNAAGCLVRPSFASDAERVVKSFRFDGATGLVTVPLDMARVPRTDLLHLAADGFGYVASAESPDERSAGGWAGYAYGDDYGSYWQYGYYRPYYAHSAGGRRFLLVDDLMVKVSGHFDEGLSLGLGARLPAVAHAASLVVTYEANGASLADWRPKGEKVLERVWSSVLISR